jgi:ribosomal 50S subunit-associated protein YjgA (DUF615 family)
MMRNAPGVHEVQLHIRAEAKKETGVVDPYQAFDALNALLRAEDPGAFESDIVELHRRKKQERAEQQAIEQRRLDKVREADKALFDFDEDIDDLSEVSERYPP